MADKQTIIKRFKRTLSNARGAWWVLLLIVLYMSAAGYFLDSSCLLSSTTGLPCPGCGATRAARALFDGDLALSLYFHPLLIPSAAVAAAYVFASFFLKQKPEFSDKALLIYVFILFAVFAVRMLMMFPDTPPLNYNYKAILPRVLLHIRCSF